MSFPHNQTFRRITTVVSVLALSLGVTLASTAPAKASVQADFFVGADQAIAGAGGSCETPDFVGGSGIQAAIDNASPHQIIYLCSGNFSISSTIQINKDITILGDGTQNTTLDGLGTTQILRVLDTTQTDWESNSLGFDLTISDLTMKNGSAVADLVEGELGECQASPRCGGAIYIEKQASAHITRVFFHHNSAINGGAIGAEGDLVYNAYGSSFTVDKSYFSNNEAQRDGGAISILYSSGREAPIQFTPTTVTNSTFVNNVAGNTGRQINSNFAFMNVENSSFYSNATSNVSDLYGGITIKYSLLYRSDSYGSLCQQNSRVSPDAGNYASDNSCQIPGTFASRSGENSASDNPPAMLVNAMPSEISTPTPIRFRLESPATGFLTTPCSNLGDDSWGTSRIRDNGTCEVGSWQRPAGMLSSAEVASVLTPAVLSPVGHPTVDIGANSTLIANGNYVVKTGPKLNGQTITDFTVSTPYTGSNYCGFSNSDNVIWSYGLSTQNETDPTGDCTISLAIPGDDTHDSLDLVQHFTVQNNRFETELTYPVNQVTLPGDAGPISPSTLPSLKFGNDLRHVTYESSDEGTCTVDSGGVVTPVDAGPCAISVSATTDAGGGEVYKTYYLPITSNVPVTCNTNTVPPSSLLHHGILDSLTQVCSVEPNFNYDIDATSNPGIEYKGYLYFSSNSRRIGRELFRTDGKTTEAAADLVPGFDWRGRALNSNPTNFVLFQGQLYFTTDSAPDENRNTHTELNKTDGRTTTSIPLVDDQNNQLSLMTGFVELDGKLYFSAENGSGAFSLWSFDGQTIAQVSTLAENGFQNPYSLVVYQSALYFTGRHSDYSSDFYRFMPSSSSQPFLSLCEFATDCAGIYPQSGSATVWNNNLYIQSSDPTTFENGIIQIHRESDGKDSATNLALGSTIHPESLVSNSQGVYFLASGPESSSSNTSTGKEIYRYDGTSVAIVEDLVPNDPNNQYSSGVSAYGINVVGGKVFMSTTRNSSSDDVDLFVIDETNNLRPVLYHSDADSSTSSYWVAGLLKDRVVVTGYSDADSGYTNLYYSGAEIGPIPVAATAPSINDGGSTDFNFFLYGSPSFRIGSGAGHEDFGPTNLSGALDPNTLETTVRSISATAGTWLHGIQNNSVFQWYRCTSPVAAETIEVPSTCQLIPNATSATYIPAAEDVDHFLAVREASNNDYGTGYSFSKSTSVIDGPPMTLAGHNPFIQDKSWIGDTIRLDRGTWVGLDGNPLQITWISCALPSDGLYGSGTLPSNAQDCRDISGSENQDSLVVPSSEIGRFIMVRIYATGTSNSREQVTTYFANSNSTVANRPSVAVAPKLTGKQKVGETLTAKAATWQNAGAISGLWYRCTSSPQLPVNAIPTGCTALANNKLTYKTVTADAGFYIVYIETTGKNSTTFFSASPAIRVFAVPAVKTVGAIRGTAKVGQTLTYTNPVWTGPVISQARQWYACSTAVKVKTLSVPSSCKKISGATGTTIRLVAAQKAKFVTVFETATNPVGVATTSAASTIAVKP